MLLTIQINAQNESDIQSAIRITESRLCCLSSLLRSNPSIEFETAVAATIEGEARELYGDKARIGHISGSTALGNFVTSVCPD
jgi:hypothetical protein